MNNKQRVEDNIRTLQDLLKKEPQNSNIKIIKENLERLIVVLEKHDELNVNSNTWFDVCYNLNHLAALCEAISQAAINSEVKIYWQEMSNLAIANAYILSGFMVFSLFTNNALKDTQLRQTLIVFTRGVFKDFFMRVEVEISNQYKALNIVSKSPIAKLEKLWLEAINKK